MQTNQEERNAAQPYNSKSGLRTLTKRTQKTHRGAEQEEETEKLGNICKLGTLGTRAQLEKLRTLVLNKDMPTNQGHFKQGGRNDVNSCTLETLETGPRKQENKRDL